MSGLPTAPAPVPVAATSTPKAAVKSPTKTASTPAPVPTKPTAKTAGIASLSFLLGLKQPLICSVKTMSGPARSGTAYVAMGMARANFTSSSMIDDGTYLYAWTNGAATGLKLLAASSVSGSAIASNGGVDLATNLSFSCNPWITDTSFFVQPSSVSF